MGLSVTVGDLADQLSSGEWEGEELDEIRADFEALSTFLQEKGMGSHAEPETVPEWPYRGQTVGFPYSAIHYLRRARAYQRAGLELTPADDAAADDPVLQAEYERAVSNSHLINHADNEGFYVPKDFPWPLAGDFEGEVVGDVVGSSYALLRELIELAPMIGIVLEDGELSDLDANVLATEAEHPFATERMVWFTLYEASRQSIEQKSAITFG